MKLLSRREYNLILRSLDKYVLYMNAKEKQLSEELQDKLYYNLYNPKDGIAQTDTEDNVIRSLNFTSYVARIARKLRRVTPLKSSTFLHS